MDVETPSVTAIERARDRLGDAVRHTPVWAWRDDPVTAAFGARGSVHLKLEAWQHAGSFKPRGALLCGWQLDAAQKSRGVTAVSAGNHAMAVGYAAKALGTHAKVVMPRTASEARVAKCRGYGAEVVLVDDVHQAFATVEQIQADEGRTFIHPFEGPLTALGTATVGLEWLRDVADLDAVIVPIGGGGLCAGIAAAVKQLKPTCAVYGVEPVGADTMTRSLAAGQPTSIDRVNTIADSLGAPHAAPYSFALCQRFVDDVVTITDEELCMAMARLFDGVKLAVEPAGAAATAAAWGPLRARLQNKRVGILICGANIDAATFTSHLHRGTALLTEAR
ncbi:MAG: threonine/serine dehydratase [Myxococcota bacterium]